MKKYRLALLFVILIAFFLRVWQLPHIPAGLWYDEAYNAMDAMWMAETGQYQPFVVGNNGREAMWHLLLSVSISVWGNTAFAARWLGSLAGLLTIPIIYRFTLAMVQPFVSSKKDRYWFAVAAAGWVAVSWWHLLNSRAGFRPILLPPLLMASLYFFWRGVVLSSEFRVQSSEFRVQGSGFRVQGSGFQGFSNSPVWNFVLAGFFLGLAQYTYLPARLAPLIFIGLTILWTLTAIISSRNTQHATRTLYSTHYALRIPFGLLITGLVAAIVFIPLGLFFLNNPAAFSSRTQDVAFTPDSFGELLAHLGQAISLFLGAGHELYRHHLPGRAMLGWLEIPFFWVGLLTLLRPTHLRRPQTHLILLGFGLMWLPALLASPPVHALRSIGLLPFYYFIVTVGLYQLTLFTHYATRNTQHATRTMQHAFPLAIAIFISLNGLINSYDYFQRWANHPEVYKEFNGPLVDLTQHVIDLTETRDVIIPFHVYAHPVTRYFLHDTFVEVDGTPPRSDRPTDMLIVPDQFQLLYVGNIPYSPALVLLTRDDGGQGKIYVSRPPRSAEQPAINAMLESAQPTATPFLDKMGREMAYFITLPQNNLQPFDDAQGGSPISNLQSPISNLFTPTPLRTIDLTWAGAAQLQGYDVTPQLARPGQPITINFYWRSLTELTFDDNLFLQLVDAAGNPLNQWEGVAFLEDMYRWRWGGILPSQHTLWLGPDTPSGPYLIRVGFFDRHTGERLPLRIGELANGRMNDEDEVIDQVHLGLFYVSPDGSDPRIPDIRLAATFSDSIQLTGVTLPDIQNSVRSLPVGKFKTQNSKLETQNPKLETQFHWKSLHPTATPQTVFLQLLDDQGQVIAGWDSQPFNGLYPTNLWSPGEAIADTFVLPLPEAGLSPGTYRLITGFYDFETGQRLTVEGGGDFAELAVFEVVVE